MTIEAPPRRHRLAVAVRVTVGLVAAAVVWLLVLLIVTGAGGYPIDGPFAPLARWLGAVLLVGWLASLTGVVLAFVARRRAGSAREAKRMLTTALALLPAALIGCIGLALLVLLWVGFSHPFADNPAADAGGRLSSELRAHGGSELCTSADPGLGPDNVQPWYDAWIEVPTASTDDRALRAALIRAGFTASPNQVGIGKAGTASARIDDLGSTDVAIDCSTLTEQWGHHHTAEPGHEILDVQVELPPKQ